MMGPGFGEQMARSLTGVVISMVVGALVVGALVGIGCQAGCGYLREHVNVEWKR